MAYINGNEILFSANVNITKDGNAEVDMEAPNPRALVQQIRFLDEENNKTVLFEDVFVGHFNSAVQTTCVYGLEAHATNSTTQTIYISRDGGETWKAYATLAINASNGVWYTRIFVDQQSNITYLYLLKTTTGFSMSNNYVCSFFYNGTDWQQIGNFSIGRRQWLSNNNSIDVTTNADWTERAVIFGEYDVTTDGTSYKLWKTTNSGATWTNVLELQGDKDGAVGTGDIRHWHTVQVDRYTKHWWATSGDADSQCRIYRSTDNGNTWELLFSGSQRERTCGFVFEKDCIYYGMDSTNKVDENSIKIVKIDKAKLETDRDNCREDVATVDSAYAVYGLTKTFYPNGFIVWTKFEASVASFEKDRHVLQFYDYGTGKMYPIARIKTSHINKSEYIGFNAGSRLQCLESGIVFACPTRTMHQALMGDSNVSTHIKVRITC